jgi:hypothetical protein
LTSVELPGVDRPDQALAGGNVSNVLVTPAGPTRICANANRAAPNQTMNKTSLRNMESDSAGFMHGSWLSC